VQKYDISLYGHMTIDRIFNEFDESISLGAMANVWSAISKLGTGFSVKLNPTALGEAIVLINKKNAQRVGRGNLNLSTTTPTIYNSMWHHIMYLNRLNTDFIDDIKTGIISADLTDGEINVEDHLDKIDYLFLSDENLFMDIDELGKLVKGWVILHYPSGSYTTNGKQSYTHENKVVKNINVLGAGDTFAAVFITSMLNASPNNIDKILENTHKKTSELLIEGNKTYGK